LRERRYLNSASRGGWRLLANGNTVRDRLLHLLKGAHLNLA
jgi:hypothetical protein